eukprot:4599801-Prorocentrum_lima.AAC.1
MERSSPTSRPTLPEQPPLPEIAQQERTLERTSPRPCPHAPVVPDLHQPISPSSQPAARPPAPPAPA